MGGIFDSAEFFNIPSEQLKDMCREVINGTKNKENLEAKMGYIEEAAQDAENIRQIKEAIRQEEEAKRQQLQQNANANRRGHRNGNN
ncbi:MAG: hypothetical protein K6B14_12025 [Lachnospiraceae bacterium]|nr:hypothetical protein [Lachnospiraceae bacterium]